MYNNNIFIKKINFSLARTKQHFQKAYQLVHKLYSARQLMEQNDVGMRYSASDLFSPGFTAISSFEERIIGTGSVFLDSPMGLPADTVFSNELNSLRKIGKTIGEGSMLSCEGYLNIKAHHLSAEIFGISMFGATLLGVQEALLVVHPRHVRYYKRMYGWEPISETKDCGHVKGKPGVLIRLDLKQKPHLTMPRFLVDKLDRLSKKEQAAFFSASEHSTDSIIWYLSHQPNIFKKLTRKQSGYIESMHPGIFDTLSQMDEFLT